MIKRKREKIIKNKWLYFIFISVLIALILLLLISAYKDYSTWRTQRGYFNQPSSKIEPWMTIRMISERFVIGEEEIFRELNVSRTQINHHITLDRFCKQYHQNCTEIVQRLNLLVGK